MPLPESLNRGLSLTSDIRSAVCLSLSSAAIARGEKLIICLRLGLTAAPVSVLWSRSPKI